MKYPYLYICQNTEFYDKIKLYDKIRLPELTVANMERYNELIVQLEKIMTSNEKIIYIKYYNDNAYFKIEFCLKENVKYNNKMTIEELADFVQN